MDDCKAERDIRLPVEKSINKVIQANANEYVSVSLRILYIQKNKNLKKTFANKAIKNLSTIKGGKTSRNKTEFIEENENIWG